MRKMGTSKAGNPDPQRQSAHRRGYTRRWQRARLAFLSAHPLCEIQGQDCTRLATVVDHRQPHRGNVALFWDQANWQAACKPCHDRTKQAMERAGTTNLPPARGCDASGAPLDAGHWWNK